MKLIDVRDLSFSYDDKNLALDNVSFCVESGKYISIIGHNGSGKSTIAKLLMGLLEAKSGTINAFDLAYNRKNIRAIRKHIGIVFQNPDNQFIGTTVQDDLAFGLENHQVPQKEMSSIINEYATKVNMSEYLSKEPEMLSGGQKQRVAIAGVLAMKPDVIIFDEATAMLDPKGKKEINETIKAMRKENPNLALLSITHDIEEAFQSDEIIILNKGKIVRVGSPKQILEFADELEALGLDQPFVYKLNKALNNAGISVNEKEHLDSLVAELCR